MGAEIPSGLVTQPVRIERMAIVDERQWEGLVLPFTAKALCAFPIQYFGPAQLAAARA